MEKALLELASWGGGLTYYMMKEENPTNHLVLVENRKGKQATFHLEMGTSLRSDLEGDERIRVRRMICDSKHIFLEYWNDIKSTMKA